MPKRQPSLSGTLSALPARVRKKIEVSCFDGELLRCRAPLGRLLQGSRCVPPDRGRLS